MSWRGVPLPTSSRAEWLAARKDGIGASDVAAILGLSPWRTAFEVWAEKTKDYEDDASESMGWGLKLEDVVIDEFEASHGLHVHARQWLVAHNEHPWAMATLDGLAFESPGDWPAFEDVGDQDEFDPLGVVEVKTSSDWSRWEEIPEHYQIQLTWQMHVTGLEHAWCAVLHGGRRFEVYEYEYDEALAAVIFGRVEAWREKHILGGEPPDPEDTPGRVLSGLWPGSEDDIAIELSLDMAADLDQLRVWKAEQKKVNDEVTRLENRLKVSMQEATIGTIHGETRVTWKPVTSRRVDVKRLQAERPDIAQKYTAESSSRRFLIK